MKVVIIGNNGHIGYVTQGIKVNPDLTPVGVAPGSDADSPETLRKLAADLNCSYFDSYPNMLDKTCPGIAAVATRYDQNGPISVACLERGIHCFTEKAIAHNLETLDQIRKTAEKTNTTIIGMHAMRYTPHIYAVWKAVKDGAVGVPTVILSRKAYKFGAKRPDFYKSRATYGGTILWVASHAVDWSYWMLGGFKTLTAFHTTHHNFGYNECESGSIIAFTTATGALGSISADYYQPLKAEFHGDDQVRVAGEKGVVEARYGRATLTTHEEAVRELPLEEGDFFGDVCRQIQGKGQCRISMEDTFAVTRTCILARDSADQNGKTMNI